VSKANRIVLLPMPFALLTASYELQLHIFNGLRP
jgi:hypothetical protein